MDNSENIQSAKRLSFFELIENNKYRIVIPVIQRDYAQGRSSAKEVRDAFLDNLYKYLKENKINRDLDFVYGSLKKTGGTTDFIPLDGQQRLTTLFLLHWYLYQISDNVEKKKKFKNASLVDGKSMFTYETRASSSEFCDALMDYNIDFNDLLDADKDIEGNSKGNSLSKTIRNLSWFYLSWKYDPTIQSMLTMLDAINNKFTKKKEFFERLIDIENRIITFLFLNLEDFKLTDDLYIKMNSRGKPLTAFENFKAKFEQYIETIDTDRKFSLTFGNTIKEVSLKEYFSHNIDTKWANLFWNYRTLQNYSNVTTDNIFDDELMNFIRIIFTNSYAVHMNTKSNEEINTLNHLLVTKVAKNSKNIITFNKYDELKVILSSEYDDLKDISKDEYDRLKKLSLKYILYLIDAFDNLTNEHKKIKNYLLKDYKFYYDENKVFENALMHSFESNHQRVCFYAYVSYLIANKDDRSGINQWMRVIHNLSHPENTIIDDAEKVANALKSITDLLPNSSTILEHLKQNPTIKSFSSWQVLEEKIKAHLITRNDNWKNKIEEVEKHRYFNGQIGFILDFSGILEYYTTHNNCDWEDQENDNYFEKFLDYVAKSSKIFEESYENRINDKDFLFERAVLTKGNYLTDALQDRKNLLSGIKGKNIKRDHSWKRLLRISDDKAWINRRLLVKDVFDDPRFDKENLENSLDSICVDITNTWRDYFITCPSLIEYCKQGFIRFKNDKNILLYGASQINHKHAEMYSYFLWKKDIETNLDSFKPFTDISYEEVKSSEYDPRIVLSGFSHNEINYEAYIYYRNNDELPNPYEIMFIKPKGENLPEEYGDDIKNILKQCAFEWNNEYSGYFFTCDNNDELIVKLNQLTESINKINP